MSNLLYSEIVQYNSVQTIVSKGCKCKIQPCINANTSYVPNFKCRDYSNLDTDVCNSFCFINYKVFFVNDT